MAASNVITQSDSIVSVYKNSNLGSGADELRCGFFSFIPRSRVRKNWSDRIP